MSVSRKVPLPARYLAVKLNSSAVHVASCDRVDGMFDDFWFGRSYRMQGNVRSCRAGNL